MIDKYGESISAYDLNNSKITRKISTLNQELKYNPKPYDLGFQAEMKRATEKERGK